MAKSCTLYTGNLSIPHVEIASQADGSKKVTYLPEPSKLRKLLFSLTTAGKLGIVLTEFFTSSSVTSTTVQCSSSRGSGSSPNFVTQGCNYMKRDTKKAVNKPLQRILNVYVPCTSHSVDRCQLIWGNNDYRADYYYKLRVRMAPFST